MTPRGCAADSAFLGVQLGVGRMRPAMVVGRGVECVQVCVGAAHFRRCNVPRTVALWRLEARVVGSSAGRVCWSVSAMAARVIVRWATEDSRSSCGGAGRA